MSFKKFCMRRFYPDVRAIAGFLIVQENRHKCQDSQGPLNTNLQKYSNTNFGVQNHISSRTNVATNCTEINMNVHWRQKSQT